MKANRRDFLKTIIAGSALGLVYGVDKLLASEPYKKITILHTNDTHSRIEPRPANDPRNPGQGGFARRAGLIKQIRAQEEDVLLFDAGDVFQGTPYFNVYGGEPEFKLMSLMGYNAMNIGNHEFDAGLEGFYKASEHANFTFISSNYDFSETILKEKIKTHQVFHHKGIKVGVYGLGIKLEGLVGADLYGATKYMDPLTKALEMENMLKRREKCDMVICLSHLGYDSDIINDQIIAEKTFHTDIIIGGHTHTLLDPPAIVLNQADQKVTIGQTGYGGLRLGRMDIWIGEKSGKKFVEGNTTNFFEKQ